MALTSGYYAPVTAKKVTHWKSPDIEGDGPEFYEDLKSESGQSLGRNLVRDRNGRPVKHYSPPDGFMNIPSSDGTENYVKVDERGRPWRHPLTGSAVGIKPGQTLVEYPNGDFEYLQDDYQRHLFEQSHQTVEDSTSNAGEIEGYKSDADKAREQDERDRAEFESWKTRRQSEPEDDKESGE